MSERKPTLSFLEMANVGPTEESLNMYAEREQRKAGAPAFVFQVTDAIATHKVRLRAHSEADAWFIVGRTLAKFMEESINSTPINAVRLVRA